MLEHLRSPWRKEQPDAELAVLPECYLIIDSQTKLLEEFGKGKNGFSRHFVWFIL